MSDPFDILNLINSKKDSNENYYNLLTDFYQSCTTSDISIKVQVYYILANEYLHFDEPNIS